MRLPTLLTCALLSSTLLFSGCGALIEGGVREAYDHGDNARYESKGYWGHVADAAFESDPEPESCDRTSVVVYHH